MTSRRHDGPFSRRRASSSAWAGPTPRTPAPRFPRIVSSLPRVAPLALPLVLNAGRGAPRPGRPRKLRENLHAAESRRMLRHKKSEASLHNFTGQWGFAGAATSSSSLSTRAFRAPAWAPTRRGAEGRLRRGLCGGTHAQRDRRWSSAHMDAGRPAACLELVDGNYTFLNEATLGQAPTIPRDHCGKAMRLRALGDGSYGAGILMEGTVLTVTSNPTRTSPVKRGQFVLESILGTPVPPPRPTSPPMRPRRALQGLRADAEAEMLAVHRASKPVLVVPRAAWTRWASPSRTSTPSATYRTLDAGQRDLKAGRQASSPARSSRIVRDLKRVIAHARRADYYWCLTEKLMATYAARGRGLEPPTTCGVGRPRRRQLQAATGAASRRNLMGIIDARRLSRGSVWPSRPSLSGQGLGARAGNRRPIVP